MFYLSFRKLCMFDIMCIYGIKANFKIRIWMIGVKQK